jgi:hypothetical protein
MRQIYFRLSLIILACLATVGMHAMGQRDSTKLNQNVEVAKPYKPSISNANKLNQLPVIEDTTRFTPEFKYSIESHPISSGFKAVPIGAAEIKGQPENNSGIGYLKLGLGTYNTSYGDFFLNTPKSTNWLFGLHLQHLASQGSVTLAKGEIVDAPYSQNKAEIFGSGVIGNSTLSSNLTYNRDLVRFYGYPDTIPRNISSQNQYAPYFGLDQIFQKTAFNIALKSNEGSQADLKYNGGLRFHHFDAKTGQQENSGGFFADFEYPFAKFKGLLESSFDNFTTKGILISPAQNKQDSWLKLSPSVLFSGDNWSLKGGVSFYSVSDNQGESTAKLYPKIDFNFIPIKSIMTLYAGVDGYLQNCNYSTIAYENNWVDPMHNIRNADHQYILFGGVKGKINKQIAYDITAKYSDVRDSHFYILKSTNLTAPFIYNNAFDVLYDNTGITNLSAEISYTMGKDYYIKFKGNYYNYNLNNLAFAPLLPDFDLDATAGFRINDRITGFTDLKVTGQRKGLIQFADGTNKEYDLDPILRLNLGADYELTHNIKIFGRIDNLFNQHYEQWPGYTSQGLRLIAGASISF